MARIMTFILGKHNNNPHSFIYSNPFILVRGGGSSAYLKNTAGWKNTQDRTIFYISADTFDLIDSIINDLMKQLTKILL